MEWQKTSIVHLWCKLLQWLYVLLSACWYVSLYFHKISQLKGVYCLFRVVAYFPSGMPRCILYKHRCISTRRKSRCVQTKKGLSLGIRLLWYLQALQCSGLLPLSSRNTYFILKNFMRKHTCADKYMCAQMYELAFCYRHLWSVPLRKEMKGSLDWWTHTPRDIPNTCTCRGGLLDMSVAGESLGSNIADTC